MGVQSICRESDLIYTQISSLCHCFIASASTMTNTAVVTEILNYFKKVPFKLLGKAEA